MLDGIVGQLLQSGAGAELLKTVQSHGLSAEQATKALTATAEGAMQHAGAAEGGLAGALGGMLGGGGAGGLASMAVGLFGGAAAPAPTTSSLSAFAPMIAHFVAQKTGLAPAMAQTVVTVALPKIEELVRTKLSGGAGGLLG